MQIKCDNYLKGHALLLWSFRTLYLRSAFDLPKVFVNDGPRVFLRELSGKQTARPLKEMSEANETGKIR